MSQARIWTGTATFTSGSSTPFGIYDSDSSFQTYAPKVASWCAKRLGYPIIDIELEGENFFAVFERQRRSLKAKIAANIETTSRAENHAKIWATPLPLANKKYGCGSTESTG